METKFTPGPWRPIVNFATYSIVNVSGEVVARVPTIPKDGNHKRKRGDAVLIAYAPYILDSLKVAVNRIEDMLKDDDGQAFKEARKVLPYLKEDIEKAGG